MSLFESYKLDFVETVAGLVYCNPFLPERIEAERRALGAEFREVDPIWSLRVVPGENEKYNIERIMELATAELDKARDILVSGGEPMLSDAERDLYEDLTHFVVFHRYADRLRRLAEKDPAQWSRRVEVWDDFSRDYRHYRRVPGLSEIDDDTEAHVFACCFQIRRAFNDIFVSLVGRSLPAARLRAKIWQSIFTHDMRRYSRVLYNRMSDFPTLVVGPSGTGKELVAAAIAKSRYIAFNPTKKAFEAPDDAMLLPLNLAALSPTLIESELFGHRRGAYTGALEDRQGWLEKCSPLSAVFLDEIGELAPALQVKILRVLESRTFQRLGETTDRRFHGKVIAATNRDLAREMEQGNFRHDLYYRLCADLIHTPSLHEQLSDTPETLGVMVAYIAKRMLGATEGAMITSEVVEWINQNLGSAYAWPGNFRELEQCVRNIVVRGSYTPPEAGETKNALPNLLVQGRLSADEMLGHYCKRVYELAGTYQEASRRLGLDHRTLKAKMALVE